LVNLKRENEDLKNNAEKILYMLHITLKHQLNNFLVWFDIEDIEDIES